MISRARSITFFLLGAASVAAAQNAPIVVARPLTVGAIVRDQGVWLGPEDNSSTRGTVHYIVTLEADLAGAVSSMHNVSYQDRMATRELLHEVHMSEGRDFDPTSGALTGLMGRLDFFIVIDGVDAATAKMRLIDVQSGSVKGVETCHKGSNACITSMTHRITAAANEIAGINGQYAAQRDDIMKIKPDWDAAVARYDAAVLYWKHIEDSIRGAGHQLRPEISTLLIGAGKDVSSGKFAIEHLDANGLKIALPPLTEKLDKLDQFK